MALPVGSIVASILSAEDFQHLMPAGEVWHLADGSPIQAGALRTTVTGKPYYKQLNISNVMHLPDLRGVFLRGQNSGHANGANDVDTTKNRSDGKGNPSDIYVGAYQPDDFKSHTHGAERPGGVDSENINRGHAWHDVRSGTTDPAGGEETRPRNVTINYYIRVA